MDPLESSSVLGSDAGYRVEHTRTGYRQCLEQINSLEAQCTSGVDLIFCNEFDEHRYSEWRWLVDCAPRVPKHAVLATLPQAQTQVAFVPFLTPFKDDGDSAHHTLELFKRHLQSPPVIAIALLRLGYYATAVAADARIVASKVGSHYVMGRHKKGGQSANRFARNRDKWIGELFSKAGAALQHCLEQADNGAEWVVLGGDRIVLKRFLASPHFPQARKLHVYPHRVSVERPNRATLELAVTDIFSVHIWRRFPATPAPA